MLQTIRAWGRPLGILSRALLQHPRGNRLTLEGYTFAVS